MPPIKTLHIASISLLLALPVPSFCQAPAAPPSHQEITVPLETLSRYAGSYTLAPNFVLTISLEDGQLMAQATGQPKAPVFAETETLFFYKIVEATLEFQVDAAGAVTGLVLKQNGMTIPGPRQ
jgi:hypothetical protein